MGAEPTSFSMRHVDERRFEDFFEEDRYVVLKNYLYNYLLRKRLISSVIRREAPDLTLEVGSGLSPMLTGVDNVVYSELSHRALCTLREQQAGRGKYVVADCTKLPFRDGVFGATVCSEVLEHVENDGVAIGELSRVMTDGGSACITVPHRRFYYAADDRFVRHFRRYELDELVGKLAAAGMEPKAIRKVLGPLEKVVMYSTVMAFSLIQRKSAGDRAGHRGGDQSIRAFLPLFKWANRAMACVAWLDARIMPRALATVIFVQGGKRG